VNKLPLQTLLYCTRRSLNKQSSSQHAATRPAFASNTICAQSQRRSHFKSQRRSLIRANALPPNKPLLQSQGSRVKSNEHPNHHGMLSMPHSKTQSTTHHAQPSQHTPAGLSAHGNTAARSACCSCMCCLVSCNAAETPRSSGSAWLSRHMLSSLLLLLLSAPAAGPKVRSFSCWAMLLARALTCLSSTCVDMSCSECQCNTAAAAAAQVVQSGALFVRSTWQITCHNQGRQPLGYPHPCLSQVDTWWCPRI
jgi:hypothetical protein